MLEIRSLNPPVDTGICDPNKSQGRHYRSLKLGSKLRHLKNRLQINQERKIWKTFTSFPIIIYEFGKKNPQRNYMEKDNRIKQNIPVLGPIIFLSNPIGSPCSRHNL